MEGPLEAVLRRCLDIFAIALSMLDWAHLSTIKRFNDKFVTMALQVPSAASLRPPTLHEAVQADRAVWVFVSQLVREQALTLINRLDEVGVCRHEMAVRCSGPAPVQLVCVF